MKTIVAANQKGGVGKTSTVVHLAYFFAEKGKKVAVIDLDTQANASFSLKGFSSGMYSSSFCTDDVFNFPKSSTIDSNIYLIESNSSLANLDSMKLGVSVSHFKKGIQSLDDSGFDICLIDTPPSLGITMASSLFVADFVISPIELEAYSIQGIKKMHSTIVNVRKTNTKLKFLGMIPSKVDSRNPRHVKHLKQLKDAYPSLIMPVSIGLRSSVADALASGVPVWKIKKTAARKAAKEIRELSQIVLDKMEIK